MAVAQSRQALLCENLKILSNEGGGGFPRAPIYPSPAHSIACCLGVLQSKKHSKCLVLKKEFCMKVAAAEAQTLLIGI